MAMAVFPIHLGGVRVGLGNGYGRLSNTPRRRAGGVGQWLWAPFQYTAEACGWGWGFGRFASAALPEHAKPCLARATIQVSPPVSPIRIILWPSPPPFPTKNS